MTGTMMHQPLTISSLISHASRYHGDTEVISVETTGGVVRSSWAEVESNARKLAAALERLGLKQGDRCGTIAWNNRRHLEVYYGVAGAGMVCHTINPRLFPDQLVYIINHAEDQVLFLDKTFVPVAAKLGEHLKTVKHVIYLGPRDEDLAANHCQLVAVGAERVELGRQFDLQVDVFRFGNAAHIAHRFCEQGS